MFTFFRSIISTTLLYLGCWYSVVSHLHHKQGRDPPAQGERERGDLLQTAGRHVGHDLPSSQRLSEAGLLVLELPSAKHKPKSVELNLN